MTDSISQENRSKNMGRIRSKNTSPEIKLRKLIHLLGYRFRLHRKDLPGKPDIVFPGKKKVIFVHGCFWHQHNDNKCKISRIPKSRTEYWIPKLTNNKKRDKQHQRELEQMGWQYLIIWECEINTGNSLREKISSYLSD